MRLTLFKKILFSMLLISSLMVVGIAGLIDDSFQQGLQRYLNHGEERKLRLVSENLSSYYSEDKGWDELTPEVAEFILGRIFARPSEGEHEPQKSRSRYVSRLLKRITVFDTNWTPLWNKNIAIGDDELIKVPIKYNQKIVGWVATKKRDITLGALESSFHQQQKYNLMWIVLWVTLISFVLSWLLVRHLLTPLKRLEDATSSIQEGDYQTQIEIDGEDELAALSMRFNELSQSLLVQKETREQWLADISHELRTPISVLKSEIEALQDGIRKPEPKYIDSLHYQVQNLNKLVNDLYQLSLSDAGMQFDLSESVNIKKLIENNCLQYQLRFQEKKIQLQHYFQESAVNVITGDSKALTQLFSNLFENSLRYTDGPGILNVQVTQDKKIMQIRIEDSAPGVPDAALPKLFERLFRVDESRSRLSGGSGLGLSICQTIVKAHHGKMLASHSELGGLAITIHLPIASH
ncbi:ATP-binding protein [Psychromonas sp. GE-S-Ul-11]|uniref:ATP-binding protein n=1 Tax=Psychromonas sp. GE-S-Ul-11 TaxID=3241170 RepID=UPI003AB00042